MELRGGGALACVLHAHLPARQTVELHGGTCKSSDSEIEETYVSLSGVFAGLQRERLAPCTAAEFAAAAEAAISEEEGAPGLLLHTG